MVGRTLAFGAVLAAAVATRSEELKHVGPAGDGFVVATGQRIRSAGESVGYHGRPVDLIPSKDGRHVYVKGNNSLMAISVDPWKIQQDLRLPEKTGGSMTGLSLSPDGRTLWVTVAPSKLLEAKVGADGKLTWARSIDIPATSQNGPKARRNDAYPCGVALTPDGKHALVATSITNELALLDLQTGKRTHSIPVGNAPFGVAVSPDGKWAYVSNWGGRRAKDGDKTNKSAGTEIVSDEHGVPSTGTVSVIDLTKEEATAEIPVGLHPSAVLLSANGRTLYVANANSDSVSVIDTRSRKVAKMINVKPDEGLAWGSSPTGLALSKDEKTLFVSVGGNNAVAVVSVADGLVKGFVPAGWFPSAVAANDSNLFVTNVKGIGSRDPSADGSWNSHSYWGTITKVPLADLAKLDAMSRQVKEDALVPQSLRAWEKGQSNAKPIPVPAKVGEPSVFEHVVYVIKENRTYDQILGDVKKGNGEPKLCTFPEKVTPNHHALADQFVLLDNFYCNGVCSADGHAWATEGYAVDYLEKSMGAWSRSYPFSGDDALAIAPTGFLWDNALLHGLTFRNFGEFAKTEVTPTGRAIDILKDLQKGGGKYKINNTIALEPLRKYTNPASAGWSLRVPDRQRADAFIDELETHEKNGTALANLTILYLPDDHTSGTNPGSLAPASMVADNDLALGRVVDALSHSRFWPKTAIFVIEDDPQNGFDHVDGHRSVCLVASAYTKRGAVVSAFYNQTSVLHTMERILGLPPMNQMDALSPVMTACFNETPDLRPYDHLKNNVPLDDVNPAKAEIKGTQLEMAELSELQDFDEPDEADEDDLNRILWASQMGWETAYPKEWAGAHGRGLAKLKLKLDPNAKVVDDD